MNCTILYGMTFVILFRVFKDLYKEINNVKEISNNFSSVFKIILKFT